MKKSANHFNRLDENFHSENSLHVSNQKSPGELYKAGHELYFFGEDRKSFLKSSNTRGNRKHEDKNPEGISNLSAHNKKENLSPIQEMYTKIMKSVQTNHDSAKSEINNDRLTASLGRHIISEAYGRPPCYQNYVEVKYF